MKMGEIVRACSGTVFAETRKTVGKKEVVLIKLSDIVSACKCSEYKQLYVEIAKSCHLYWADDDLYVDKNDFYVKDDPVSGILDCGCNYFVYLMETISHEAIYVGSTTDPNRRLNQHFKGWSNIAENRKYLKWVEYVVLFPCGSKADMMYLEEALIAMSNPLLNTVSTGEACPDGFRMDQVGMVHMNCYGNLFKNIDEIFSVELEEFSDEDDMFYEAAAASLKQYGVNLSQLSDDMLGKVLMTCVDSFHPAWEECRLWYSSDQCRRLENVLVRNTRKKISA